MQKTERWGIFEISITGKTEGNPFTDYTVWGEFTGGREQVRVRGFYDGNGVYRVRFMPMYEGHYRYKVTGTFSEENYEGDFLVVPAMEGNHGPVRVSGQYHFQYQDGTSYFPLGTTCYVWNLQSDELISQTLATLKSSPFNKIRFCIFPKHYVFNLGEPRSYPYEGTPMDSSILTEENFEQFTGNTELSDFDFARFRPEHFRHIEYCIQELMKMGIEADIILFHPYDRWGFSKMSREQDAFYLKYVTARLSAYRNVWWAFANEYDLMDKSLEDWKYYGELVQKEDPYGHLRSIHNCVKLYDHRENWITHCSIQRTDVYRTSENTDEWRRVYQKPVVLDEISYEGNIQHGWGNISGKELVRRYYEGICRGGYPQHGETFNSENQILWWSHGGTLKGESVPRIAFLRSLLEKSGVQGLKRWEEASWDEVCGVPEADKEPEYYLFYYGFMRPCVRSYHLKSEKSYRVRVIDTWNMTIEDKGTFSGEFQINLPGKEYMAVEITVPRCF
ncbi:MAG: DUF5605 domain-containing protein [Lachnospiraceae bacterium]|nr:DUF5605 domain-containing protein [Lachnospiraceae bacterium]